MASPDTQNVVVNSQSVGDSSPVDTNAHSDNTASAAIGSVSTSTPSAGKADTSIPEVRVSASPLSQTPADEDANGHAAADADAVSVQGSLAGDSARDASSVADAHDLGVGSDTDTSRVDATEQGKDAAGGAKSIKKPTSFKAVSVTRSFLAKTASATTTPKAGEKRTTHDTHFRGITDQRPAAATLGTTLTMARPRLVAKSGSGLRDSPGPRSGADSPAGGATVWNKNRPAPPPPTKHFTDEELKQQYGIHLASRLQADDDNNKQSKWADIDDDEDDWAPETLEWMDGTKSTINPEPIPAPAAKPVTAPSQSQPLEPKTILAPLRRPVVTGPPKTVLRPGAALEQAKQEAIAREAQALKQSSGPKTPAPLPTKSPWATLPPVDKAAPLADFEALQVAQQPRTTLASQDARMMDGSFQTVAREMEADTFDRAWRDSDRGPRELFNSQNGRYEPAPEGRRGSMRREQGFRGPAVLRRPSQSGGPEPVFDSHAPRGANADGSPWARRRGSSIAGQDMRPAERRVSIGQKPTDAAALSDGRAGVVIGHDIGPQAPKPQTPQQLADARQEELLRQKKIMQEKRELAIRRRKEEEEKEEAAKRERIPVKLESLGMEPTKPDTATPPAQPSAGVVTQKASQPEAASSTSQQPSGAAANGTTAPRVGQQTTGRSDLGAQHPARPPISHASPETARASADPSGQSAQDASAGLSSLPSAGELKPQPPFRSPGLSADTFATWGTRGGQPAATPSPNVWGPPGASRHIGNGAFVSSFSRIPPRMQNQNAIGQNPGFPGAGHSMSAAPRQETSPMRHQQMLSDQNLAALGLADAPLPTYQDSAPAGNALPQQMAPIAPPGRQAQAPPGLQQSPQRGTQWSQFSHAQQEGGVGADFGAPQAPQQPVTAPRWKETFKQTTVKGGWGGGRRAVVTSSQTVYGNAQGPQSLGPDDGPAPPVTHSQQPAIAPIPGPRESTVRLPNAGPVAPPSQKKMHTPPSQGPASTAGNSKSRFFPSNIVAGGSPPPEESDHPVYGDVDKRRPIVSLPSQKPRVRLPPAALAAMQSQQQQPAVIMPERAASYRGAQSTGQPHDWQARFNGLFGRIQTTTTIPPSPPRTPPKTAAVPSPAPDSSTKRSFAHPVNAATVSLPGQTSPTTSSRSGSAITSKPTVDDIFDGELSFGSTPKVVVPRNPSYNPGKDRNGLHILQMRPHERFDRRVESTSIATPRAETKRSISVHFPGRAISEVTVPAALSKRIFSSGEVEKVKKQPRSPKDKEGKKGLKVTKRADKESPVAV